MIINAENMILGRLASAAAKKALLGEDVKIVNCELAVITGDRQSIIKHYLSRLKLGQPQQGPFIQRRPDLFVRRTIRGMLPRKHLRGREALSRVKCYVNIPSTISEKPQSLKVATPNSKKRLLTVGELCMHLGDKQ